MAHRADSGSNIMGKYKKRAFCMVCGELEIKDNKIIHPALDRIMSEKLKAGVETYYINNGN